MNRRARPNGGPGPRPPARHPQQRRRRLNPPRARPVRTAWPPVRRPNPAGRKRVPRPPSPGTGGLGGRGTETPPQLSSSEPAPIHPAAPDTSAAARGSSVPVGRFSSSSAAAAGAQVRAARGGIAVTADVGQAARPGSVLLIEARSLISDNFPLPPHCTRPV